jgi:hypothetical protein
LKLKLKNIEDIKNSNFFLTEKTILKLKHTIYRKSVQKIKN